MEPTSTELDTIADLLRRWQRVDGPMERVRIVSDAADALRGLSTLDARTLAQGLWEHGAGPAAQQVADRAGTPVAPEELTDVASAVLSLDRAEVDRLATELRDPEQRRRLLIDSGIAAAEAEHHVAAGPPDDQQRIDAPPPPGATIEAPPPSDRAVPSPPPDDAEPAAATPRPATQSRPTAQDAETSDLSAPGGADAEANAVPEATSRSRMPAGRATSRDRSGGREWRLTDQLRDAPNGRARLQLLNEDHTVVQGPTIRRMLEAVPDGWQRRTALRKLIATDRIRDLPDAARLVDGFHRRGDRFAAASLLVRAGLAEVAEVQTALDPRDAARLRRRQG